MIPAKYAAKHQENFSRPLHYRPHSSSHSSQYTFSESTLYSVSPSYHHRQLDHVPRKIPYDNMKQLLSKPAIIPSLAGPSDSEGDSSRGVQKRRIASEDIQLPAGRGNRSASGSIRRSNWVAPWELEAAESSTETSSLPKHIGLFTRSPSLTRKYMSDNENVSSGKEKEKEKEKKFRSILRQKPSPNRPISPLSPDFNPPIHTVSSPSPFTSSFLSPSSGMMATNTSSARSRLNSQSSTLQPPSRSLRSSSSSPSPSRGSSRNSRSHMYEEEGNRSMTPAEEVMLAYKSQMEREMSIERSFEEVERKVIEARRLSEERGVKALREKELERGRSFAPVQSPPVRSPAKPEITPSSAPYYTVFGSASGSVLSADGYEQDPSENFRNLTAVGGLSRGNHRTASVSVGAPKPTKDSHGFGKTLGRKLSLKWNGLKSSKHENPISSMTGMTNFDAEFGGRPSLHEKRLSEWRATSPSSPDNGAYTSLRMSIERPYATTSRVPGASAESADATGSPKPHSATSSLSPTSTSTPSPVSTGSSETKGGFRSIIRRLSTSTLRDQNRRRSQDVTRPVPDTCPPPVPALPQGLASVMKTGAPSKSTGTSLPRNSIRRTRNRRSNSENGTHNRPQMSLSGAPQTMIPISSASSTTTSRRPSTATRSSSPERYFTSPRSARSSTSSYGKEIPPLPTSSIIKPDLPRYILSPTELTASQRHANDSTILDTETKPPIPPSQRRRQTSQTRSFSSASPIIPRFSVTSPITLFSKKSTTERPTTSVKSSPASPLPMYGSKRPRTSDGAPPSRNDTLPPSRKSTSFISKPANPSSSRENTDRRISSEEIWEGLLQKSARAGGTLHIRGTTMDRLESDNLRFSVTDSDRSV